VQAKAESTGNQLSPVGHKWFLRYLRYCGVSFALAALLFLHRANDYFVADDWTVIARNVQASWRDIPQWFVAVRFDWYRPVFESFVALCWQLFGLNPVGYHLTSVILYSLVSGAVGILGELLTDDQRVGVLATVLFVLLGPHAEPVLWFSSANELMAGLFAVCSVIGYVLFRKTQARLWLLASGISYVLGVTSKETALSLPLMLLAYDVLVFLGLPDKTPNWRQFLPLIPFILPVLAFVPLRIAGGHHYSVVITIPRLIMNVVFYLAIEIFALPSNYAYLASLPLWRESPWLPVVAVTLTTSVIAMISLLLVRLGFRRRERDYTRAFSLAVVLTIVALAPVILIVSERTAFLSSIGVALAVSTAVVCIWDGLTEHSECKRWMKQAVAVAAISYIATNASVLIYRSSWWGRAGEISETVLTQLDDQITELPADAEIWLVNLPDHLEYAYVFRNTFPAASELLNSLNHDRNIQTVLDSELAVLPPPQREDLINQLGNRPGAVILWYEDGVLALK
jgi:hypothetical protein